MTDYETDFQAPPRIINPLMNKAIMDLHWPYNLLACLNVNDYCNTARQVDYQVTPEHTHYIEEVIESAITKRKVACILGFFRDGLSATQIGEREGVSHSRVSQDIRKALAELHQPWVKGKILYGPEVASRQDALQQRLAKLNELEKELDRRAAVAAERLKMVQEQEATLEQHIAAVKDRYERLGLTPPTSLADGKDATCDVVTLRANWQRYAFKELPELEPDVVNWYGVYATSIDDLFISTRAYNCLFRSGYRTLGDIIEAAREKQLPRIRNLGRRTMDEIIHIARELTGEDISNS